MDTSARAREDDTPQRQATQCAGETMPAPSHAPAASTSLISDTSRPVAALITPQTLAISTSRRATSCSVAGTSGIGTADQTYVRYGRIAEQMASVFERFEVRVAEPSSIDNSASAWTAGRLWASTNPPPWPKRDVSFSGVRRSSIPTDIRVHDHGVRSPLPCAPLCRGSRYQVLEGDPTQASLLVFILDEIVGGNSA